MPLPVITTTGCYQNPAEDTAIGCAPSTTDGKITQVIFGSRPLTSLEIADLTSLEAAIDNTDATGASMHKWVVIASKEKPERGSTEVEGGVTVFDSQQLHKVVGRFYENSDLRYNQYREMQEAKPMYVYYGNADYLFGGEADFVDGINTVIAVTENRPEEGKAFFDFEFSWKDKYGPTRIAYPTDSGS